MEARRTVKPATTKKSSVPESSWYGPDRPKVSASARSGLRAGSRHPFVARLARAACIERRG